MNECIEWPHGKNSKGYGKIRLRTGWKLVHRLVFYACHGYYPQVVMHTCDNPSCYNPDHLAGGTQQDNTDDKMRKGRHVGNEKLSASKVEEIRIRLSRKEGTHAAIARDYGVAASTISMISNRSNWK